MNICIDIGHPAHVHYFRNFIKIMSEQGHDFLITARNREQVFELLRYYNLDFVDRGSGSAVITGKLLYMIKADYLLYKHAKGFRPDLFLSFASTYAAHASKLMGKPHIAFDDTEHSKFEHMLYQPFTDLVCTPACFTKDFGRKHRRFNGYMELCHLHPNYFKPDETILNDLGVAPDEKFSLMRFISWNAGHDSGHSGMSLDVKRKAVKELQKFGKVFISSEGQIPEEFAPFKLPVPSHKMHDVLYYASLLFGESGTMSTEAALLGTPTVRVSTLAKLLGNYKELRDTYELLFFYDSGEEGLETALKLIANGAKAEWQDRKKRMLAEKVDVTQFMIDTVLNLRN